MLNKLFKHIFGRRETVYGYRANRIVTDKGELPKPPKGSSGLQERIKK